MNQLLQDLLPGFEHHKVPVGEGVQVAASIGCAGQAEHANYAKRQMAHDHPQAVRAWCFWTSPWPRAAAAAAGAVGRAGRGQPVLQAAR